MTIPDELFVLISSVSSGNGSTEDYERICLILSNLSTTELRSVFRKCDILKALMSINLQDKQSSQIAMKLATIVFSLVPLFDFVQSHEDELLLIIESTKFDLIEFILKRVTTGITVLGSKCPLGLKKVLGAPIIDTLKSSCTKPEHSIRVSEFAVHLASVRPEIFQDVKNSGLLQPILDGLSSRDPLVCLNWLELAKMLTDTQTGYQFLSEKDIFTRLMNDLRSFSSDSLADLLLPGYIAFFGNLAKHVPDYWLDDSNKGGGEGFKDILANAVENKNISISMTALETVGCIATTLAGRIALNRLFGENDYYFFLFKALL
ncbi:unnamed protein product [Trichobilharzia regenti]|nr:unnamed protein product [Trichobilharzia regenti]